MQIHRFFSKFSIFLFFFGFLIFIKVSNVSAATISNTARIRFQFEAGQVNNSYTYWNQNDLPVEIGGVSYSADLTSDFYTTCTYKFNSGSFTFVESGGYQNIVYTPYYDYFECYVDTSEGRLTIPVSGTITVKGKINSFGCQVHAFCSSFYNLGVNGEIQRTVDIPCHVSYDLKVSVTYSCVVTVISNSLPSDVEQSLTGGSGSSLTGSGSISSSSGTVSGNTGSVDSSSDSYYKDASSQFSKLSFNLKSNSSMLTTAASFLLCFNKFFDNLPGLFRSFFLDVCYLGALVILFSTVGRVAKKSHKE